MADLLMLIHPVPAFNLINEIDIPTTEARIAAFRAENAALIQLNIQREKLDAQELQEEEERDRRDREERMRELRREEEEERQERENERRAIIEGLVRMTFTRFCGNLTKAFTGVEQRRLSFSRHCQNSCRGTQAHCCPRSFILHASIAVKIASQSSCHRKHHSRCSSCASYRRLVCV